MARLKMRIMVARLLPIVFLLSPAFAQDSKFLSNPRQLTSGGQNAEAYWSPDGKRLVFQSTRDGASCDQIYVMEADGKNVKRISNGAGATTCGTSFRMATTSFTVRLTRKTPRVRPARIAPKDTCGPSLRLMTSMSQHSMER